MTPAPSQKDCKKPQEPVTPVAPTMTPHEDANDGLWSRPTTPMSTTKGTTWPTWTEKPTSWPSWSDKPTTPWDQGTSTTWGWVDFTTTSTSSSTTTTSTTTSTTTM